MQNGGRWSVHNCSFLLLFPPHMFFCSSMSPSHRLQYFKAGCRVDCVYGLLAFWIRLLQCGSSRGHSSCQEPASAWALHGPQFLPGISSWSGEASSMGCCVGICSTMVFPLGCLGISAPLPGAPPPPPSSLALVFASLFLTITFSPFHTSCAVFCPSLNMFSRRHHQRSYRAQHWAAESLLEPIGPDSVRHGCSCWTLPTEATLATLSPSC